MKPYAWVSLPENEIQILPFPDDGKTLVAGDGFYLYTHPVKELTGGYEVLDMNKYDVTVRMTVSDWEAILRKAQEK